jgi:excisionase family DNA binding protein
MTRSKRPRKTIRAVFTIPEAAERLGIGEGLTYRLAREGRIPVLRLGRRFVVPKEQLEALLTGGR